MKSTRAWIAAGFVLASSMAPATAADWGGVKDMGGGVPIPVPAPAPVPTYDADSDWYVGLAIGGNLSTSATIRDSDINMPIKDDGDIAMSPTFGLSFGRYITPSLRWEIAVDYTPDTSLTGDGIMKYATLGEQGTAIENQEYGVFRKDSTKLSRTTALFSLIYDFNNGTRFTPYVGVGGGFTWRRLKRSSSEVASCSDTFDFPGITCGPGVPGTLTSSGSTSKNQIDLAASVQAGIATNITDQILWDNGWQMLWEGGAISVSTPSVSGENRFTYKDSVVQQFRSGIRIKFD